MWGYRQDTQYIFQEVKDSFCIQEDENETAIRSESNQIKETAGEKQKRGVETGKRQIQTKLPLGIPEFFSGVLMTPVFVFCPVLHKLLFPFFPLLYMKLFLSPLTNLSFYNGKESLKKKDGKRQQTIYLLFILKRLLEFLRFIL